MSRRVTTARIVLRPIPTSSERTIPVVPADPRAVKNAVNAARFHSRTCPFFLRRAHVITAVRQIPLGRQDERRPTPRRDRRAASCRNRHRSSDVPQQMVSPRRSRPRDVGRLPGNHLVMRRRHTLACHRVPTSERSSYAVDRRSTYPAMIWPGQRESNLQVGPAAAGIGPRGSRVANNAAHTPGNHAFAEHRENSNRLRQASLAA